MKKNFKKYMSFVLAFVFVFMGLVHSFAKDDANNTHKTTLHITKLQADSYKNGPVDHDGRELTLGTDTTTQDTVSNKLGTIVKGLDGVTFTYWKVTEDQLKNMMKTPSNYDTTEKVKTYINDNTSGTTTEASKDGGKVTVSGLEEGFYWFVESQKPETVSSAIAVPFGISLPLTNPENIGADGKKKESTPAGTLLMTDVYIYPKNVTGTLPEPDKTVDDVERKLSTKYVGEEITWFLQATVPAENIKDYKQFDLKDTLDPKLSYVKGQTVEVFYANKDGTTNKTDLTTTTDYTLTEPTEDKGGTLEVKLTEAGIKKLSDNFNKVTKEGKVFVKFKTTINSDAVMGEEIQNDYTLTFNNSSDTKTKKEKQPPQKPKVVTGGKKFIKTDDKDADVLALKDAEFVVKNTTNGKNGSMVKYLKQTTTNGTYKNEWVDDEKKATKFKSDASGKFEVKGLQYSEFTPKKWNGTTLVDDTANKVTNKYTLKEVTAPNGYALLKDEISFTIDANSYTTGETVKLKDNGEVKDSMRVKNKKLTIPQTGGIGSLIFVAVGVLVMGVAVFMMKRKNSEQK